MNALAPPHAISERDDLRSILNLIHLTGHLRHEQAPPLPAQRAGVLLHHDLHAAFHAVPRRVDGHQDDLAVTKQRDQSSALLVGTLRPAQRDNVLVPVLGTERRGPDCGRGGRRGGGRCEARGEGGRRGRGALRHDPYDVPTNPDEELPFLPPRTQRHHGHTPRYGNANGDTAAQDHHLRVKHTLHHGQPPLPEVAVRRDGPAHPLGRSMNSVERHDRRSP
mmetsp:Transcript_11149/g.31292  ORF Transcript_11149/g.31292 Transcript_11149/m.31292 type:complete len:221 (-) Transcript_11149:1720-2382(-)